MTLSMRRRSVVLGALAASCGSFGIAGAAVAAAPATPYIDELTWTELRDRVAAGTTTVLVPIGGTEQSGPHMVLGKHNVRAHVLAGRIALKLGNALVAPVIAYVPEGSIDPPAGHMRFPGTISISEAAFEAVLESAAKSFRQHGFRDVFFLGDHGGYQTSLQRVAGKLEREWRGRSGGQGGAATPGCRVHALLDYYRATQGAYVDALKARGFTADEIGTHAGLADTALSLAVDPALVRPGALGREPKARDGVYGDPRKASAELGQLGVDQIVAASVAAIRAMTGAH